MFELKKLLVIDIMGDNLSVQVQPEDAERRGPEDQAE